MLVQRRRGRGVWVAAVGALLLALVFPSFPAAALAPGSAAVVAYGQASLGDAAPNHGLVSAFGLTYPNAVALDDAGGAYVADTFNSRVLFFPPGATVATRVYGQPTFASRRPNNDGDDAEGPPSATTLNAPAALALAPNGLYVADSDNNRVLFFPGDSTTATGIYGQPDFASRVANNDGAGGAGSPSARGLDYPCALAVSAEGLYVAERDSNRVLFFPAPVEGTRLAAEPLVFPAATRVYGQPSFTTKDTSGTVDARTLSYPDGLAVDATGLYVADTNTNRVVFFPAGGPATNPAATRVYGQDTLGQSQGSYETSARTMRNPGALALSAAGLYVADRNNNRVLFFPANSPAADPVATMVFGQEDFAADSPNRGAGDEGTPSAQSLAFPEGLALSAAGLLVADSGNDRALRFPLDGTAATTVYGQPTFATNLNNAGTLDASGLRYPRSVAGDAEGGVYVADGPNNRVLYFPPGATIATRVYGQPDFTSRRAGRATPTSLSFPSSVAVSAEGLYVADTTHSRVLFFPHGGPATNPAATRVYGQPDFTSDSSDNNGDNRSGTPTAYTLDDPRTIAVDDKGLYVGDDNNRVLFFPHGGAALHPAATRVYGQPNFTDAVRNNDGAGGYGSPNAANLWDGEGIAPAPNGVYIADPWNERVLFYPGTSTTATRVIGQPDFTSSVRDNDGKGNQGAPNAHTLGFPLGVVATASGVYVADIGSNRVAFFPANGPATYPAATAVFGQPDFAGHAPNNDGKGVERRPSVVNLNGPWGLSLDGTGRLLIADFDNSRVLAVEDPIAGLALSAPNTLAAGQSAPFAASVSAGSGVRFRWTFGDGAAADGALVSHRYAAAGTYTVTVQATNGLGSASATREVRVTAAAVSEKRYNVFVPIVVQ